MQRQKYSRVANMTDRRRTFGVWGLCSTCWFAGHCRLTVQLFTICEVPWCLVSSEFLSSCLKVSRISTKLISSEFNVIRLGSISVCEDLIRHMLLVQPERRFSLAQISKHPWMVTHSQSISTGSCGSGSLSSSSSDNNFASSPGSPGGMLDSVVVKHMQQLPGLTSEMIMQSVLENRFDHIYAMYNLLVDKLQTKRREQQRLEHHAGLAYSR